MIHRQRNIDDMIRKTPPHLLNQQNRKRPHMSASTPISQIIGGSRMNPTNASSGNYNKFRFLPTSIGDSSSLLQSQTVHTGVVPQDGIRHTYTSQSFYPLPQKTSATSGPPYKEDLMRVKSLYASLNWIGTTRAAKHNPSDSEHMRLLLEGRKSGGSNSRTQQYQLPHQLSSFYHVAAHAHGNDWNHHFQYHQLAPYHCSQPERNEQEQLSLPSYWSSQITRNSNTLYTVRTRATSLPVLGKCPTVSNPAHSLFQPLQSSLPVLSKRPIMSNPSQSFQPPPPSSSIILGKSTTTSNPVQSFFQPPPLLPTNTNDVEPLCRLQTNGLLRLVRSMGMPEFLASKVLRSQSSLYDHLPSPSAHIPVRGTSASSTPNMPLDLGNGRGVDKGKGKQGRSYWDLDDMVEMMESMNKRQRKVTSQPVPDLALGSDDQGGSKNKIN